MTLFVCLECGHKFEEGEEAHWRENHGNGIIEPWTGCPVCYGAYEEVNECRECVHIIDD